MERNISKLTTPMDAQFTHNLFERRPIIKSKSPAVKWLRECSNSWDGASVSHILTEGIVVNCPRVPQDVVATENQLKALKETAKEPPVPEAEPESTTEVLFLCSFEGCGKTSIDAGALRKHSHIHGERQYVCHYEGCGKKFLDSSKLKRHFLIHTGERDFVCPHEVCGKAFSLDFNLRSHMKTHSHENYHICPYPDCGKRYAHEYNLKNHISTHHEKNRKVDVVKYTTPPEKIARTSKTTTSTYLSASPDRPYACPYKGCEKAYIHEYKLKLHLRREHTGHMLEENAENAASNADNNEMDEASDQDAYTGKKANGKSQKQSRPKPNLKMPPAKITQCKNSSPSLATLSVMKKQRPVKDDPYEEEDSEETEEDHENAADGWRHGENNDEDDEMTDED